MGMHADKTYQVKAISTNGGGSVSAISTHKSGSLPSTIPVGKVTVNETTKTQPGWTLMNVQKGNGKTTSTTFGTTYPAQAVLYDAEGQPVWYYIDGTTPDASGAVSVDLTDKGVLIGPVPDSSR